METIQAIYLKASKELSSMPPEPSTDPAAELLILINAFHADLLAATEGYLGSEGLIRRLNEVYREFGEAIWQTAPRFTPFTRAEIDGDEEDEMDCSNLLDDIEGVDKLSTSLGGQAASVKNLDDVSESIEQYDKSDLKGVVADHRLPDQSRGNCPTTFRLRVKSVSSSTWCQLGLLLLKILSSNVGQ